MGGRGRSEKPHDPNVTATLTSQSDEMKHAPVSVLHKHAIPPQHFSHTHTHTTHASVKCQEKLIHQRKSVRFSNLRDEAVIGYGQAGRDKRKVHQVSAKLPIHSSDECQRVAQLGRASLQDASPGNIVFAAAGELPMSPSGATAAVRALTQTNERALKISSANT